MNLLINNASVFEKSPIIKIDEKTFDKHFNVNFKVPFFMIREYANIVKKGNIINILDTKVRTNYAPNFTAYNLSKKNLMNFTKMAALDLAPLIRVNAIAPGAVLKSSHTSEEDFEKIIQKTPLKIKIDAKQIAVSMKYILENPNLTGQILFCDNGSHLI